MGGTAKPLSGRQVTNVLECLRAALAWARRADVRKLPADWANPFTSDLIEGAPSERPAPRGQAPSGRSAPDSSASMDRWQLTHLSLSLVLPLRPEEAAGLLVGDVDFEKGWLVIGTRLDGGDFTKGRTSFKLPFPDELRPILRACIDGRAGGPLLRGRRAFEGRSQGTPGRESGRPGSTLPAEATQGAARQRPGRAGPQAGLPPAAAGLGRRLARTRWPGSSRGLLAATGVSNGATLYTLRSSVTTAMKDANLPHLEMRYLTSHSTGDILNDYATLDPVRAMGCTSRPSGRY